MEETENDKNEEVVKQSQNKQEEFETTVWESAVTQMDVSQDANVEMVIASPNPIIPAISYVCTVRGDPRPNETSPVSKLSTITCRYTFNVLSKTRTLFNYLLHRFQIS